MTKEEKKRKKEIEEAEKKYDKKDLDPYAVNKMSRVPYWVKCLLFKYWFFGAISFFVGMGLQLVGEYFALVGGLIAGALYDIVVNNVLEAMDSDKHESKYYVFFKSKKFYSIFINILYCLVLYIIAGFIVCGLLGYWMTNSFNNNWLFQEPFTQAFVFLFFDILFINARDGILIWIEHIKKKKEKNND